MASRDRALECDAACHWLRGRHGFDAVSPML
jgi:hypothetical protein